MSICCVKYWNLLYSFTTSLEAPVLHKPQSTSSLVFIHLSHCFLSTLNFYLLPIPLRQYGPHTVRYLQLYVLLPRFSLWPFTASDCVLRLTRKLLIQKKKKKTPCLSSHQAVSGLAHGCTVPCPNMERENMTDEPMEDSLTWRQRDIRPQTKNSPEKTHKCPFLHLF